MKYKLFSVLMILAIVASLCIIATAPASAAAPAGVQATASPATAGSTATYKVNFQPTATVVAGNTISIDFPVGVTVPTAIDYRNVVLTTTGTPTAATLTAASVGVSGQRVNIQVPAGYGMTSSGSMSIVITQVAGLKNPAVSSDATDVYYVGVSTTTDTTVGYSADLGITDYITATPALLAYGQACTVKGYGFKPGASANVLPNSGVTLYGASTIAPVTVGADGTFTATAYGTGYAMVIRADDTSGRSALTTTAITVLPRLSVTPSSGPAGSPVTLVGLDFALTTSGSLSAVNIAGTQWLSAATMLGLTRVDYDVDGVADDFVTTQTLPATLSAGSYQITATQNNSQPSAVATFTVSGRAVTVNPASGAPGTSVIVSGTGFPPNGTYTSSSPTVGIIFVAGPASFTSIGPTTIQTDASGAFSVTCTIPLTAVEGTFGIRAALGADGLGYFTVTPRALTITPASGPRGTKVTLSGGGLTANGSVAISGVKFGTNNWNTAAITLDTQGNLTPTTLTVASTYGVGVNTITATDAAGKRAAGTFEVLQPTCVFDKTEASRGEMITVTGKNWLPGALGMVSIYITVGTDQFMAVAQPNENGEISTEFQLVNAALVAGSTYAYHAADASNNGNQSLPGAMKVTGAKIVADPTSGAPGTQVKIKGYGFLPQTGLSALTLGGVTLIAGQAILTDSIGSFEVTATIPGLAPQGYAISATVDVIASTAFQVKAGTAGPVTPQTAFASVSDKLLIVWTFDGKTQSWQSYDPTPGAPSEIASMTSGQGYFVKVSEDCTLTYGSKTINLYAGWNMPGW